MTNFSIKEAEALCVKAARGAGFPWGIAEEVAFASGWLAKHNLSDLSALASFLKESEKNFFSKPLPQKNHLWKAHSHLCPFMTGTYISDSYLILEKGEKLTLADIAYPLFLLPFLSTVSKAMNKSLQLSYPNFSLLIFADQFEFLDTLTTCDATHVPKLHIKKVSRQPLHTQSLHTRIDIKDTILDTLSYFARKTYVPETEELKATGAGGENVNDND